MLTTYYLLSKLLGWRNLDSARYCSRENPERIPHSGTLEK